MPTKTVPFDEIFDKRDVFNDFISCVTCMYCAFPTNKLFAAHFSSCIILENEKNSKGNEEMHSM